MHSNAAWKGISNAKIFLGETLFGLCDKAMKSMARLIALSHAPINVFPINILVLEMPYYLVCDVRLFIFFTSSVCCLQNKF